jgi:hypothetical protein
MTWFIIILFIVSTVASAYIGYKFGRRAGKWECNHPKETETPKDGIRIFLDNLNQN